MSTLAVPSDSPVQSRPAAPSARWAMAGLSLSVFMSSLDTSIANAGLPALTQAFAASFHAVRWIVLAYLLAITTLIVSVGRLGDIFGRRRLLIGGIVSFTVASALCGVAPSLCLLIAARAAQGVGAAIMLALTFALVGEVVPRSQTGRAMGLLGTVSAIGTTFGPSFGGLLITGFGWRSIFLINVPLGIANAVLAYRCLPVEHRASDAGPTAVRPRFDSLGTVLLVLTLAAYALALTLERGSFGPLSVALLFAAALGLSCFGFAQAKSTSPLIPLEMFRNSGLSAALAMSTLVSTVLMATMVVGPFYLARSLGLPAALVGMLLSVGPLVAAMAGLPAGRLVDRFGAHGMRTASLVTMAAGCVLLAVLPSAAGVAGYLGPIALITANYAMFQSANNTAAMAEISPDQRGVISGMLSLSRNLGLITGASLMGSVFAHAAATTDMMTARPEAVASGMRITFAVGAVLITVALAFASGGMSMPKRDRAALADRPQ